MISISILKIKEIIKIKANRVIGLFTRKETTKRETTIISKTNLINKILITKRKTMDSKRKSKIKPLVKMLSIRLSLS